MNGDVIRTITIRGTSEGLDKLQTDLVKVAAAHKGVAIAAEETDKKTLSLEQAWKRQTLKLDEAARAQHNIARETKIADAALKEGLATQAQHAERLNLINQHYTKTADATKVVTQQTGLARHELVNLGRQAQDVGVSLLSGQSPFTVLVQQGTQIADVFATSGGSVRGFFTQAVGWAKGFFTSTTGIVSAVAAVGAAAIYAAYQFKTASTTIEQALEEQNRLLKEGKLLLDAKTSAEAKAFAQSKELTQFQSAANQRDLAAKLDTAKSALVKGVTRPTAGGMPEMGIAPDFETAFTAAAGYEKLHTAIVAVSASLKTGQPGVIAFRDEIAKLALLNPELTATVQELLKTTEAAAGLEQAAQKAKAMSDALAGIATNAQLAAVGLGSVAQFNLSHQQAQQAAAATERQAQATLRMAAQYPGMSIEVAKQLRGLEDQVKLNDARVNGTEDLVQAEIAYTKAIADGTTELEAQAIKKATQAAADSANQKTHAQLQQEIDAELGNVGDEIQQNIIYTNQWTEAVGGLANEWARLSMIDAIGMRLSALTPQFKESSGGSFQMTSGPGGWIKDFVATLNAQHGGFTGAASSFDDKLNDNLEDLTKSTDSLNETMQNALSPYYSQDPRTTKLGFRAGVSGNPDWLTGATNANPLAAVLGAGATAPGMAAGGSFTVGGGYSANDNAMAVFPVASGEEVVVNRSPQGRGGQVVNIDNRIIIQGAVDDDALSKMKVSRYQQAQRMRAGLRG